MARIKSGILGPLVGKLANMVGYVRLGEPVLRMRPKKPIKKKPRSEAQKAVNMRFKVVRSFISAIKGFVNVGFKNAVAGTTRTAQNGAASYNMKEALIGEYPDFTLDYSKVKVCKGNLPCPINPTFELVGNDLIFKWDVDPNWDYELTRDQVMMLAYLPLNNTASSINSGARRDTRKDTLDIRPLKGLRGESEDRIVETYISFISDDRQSISDSVYVGSVDISNPKNIND